MGVFLSGPDPDADRFSEKADPATLSPGIVDQLGLIYVAEYRRYRGAGAALDQLLPDLPEKRIEWRTLASLAGQARRQPRG